MKYKVGDHLQEINTPYHGYVIISSLIKCKGSLVIDAGESSINNNDETWYLIENDELNLVNHWVPESNLELHKQPLRESKLEQLGIK